MVATYSPHRLHGGPTSLSNEPRATPKRHLSDRVPRNSPLSGPNVYSLNSNIHKPYMNITPSRTRSGSPFRLALQVTSTNNLNHARSPPSTPEDDDVESPISKITIGRQTRSSNMVTEGISSPVRKRETSDASTPGSGSMRSPKAKRRNHAGIQKSSSPTLEPITRIAAGASLDNSLGRTPPKRSTSQKKAQSSLAHHFEKPLFPRSHRASRSRQAESLKQPDFSSAKAIQGPKVIKKMTSFDTLFLAKDSTSVHKPLPNPSIHKVANQSKLDKAEVVPFYEPLPSSEQVTQGEFFTPQNYKNVKPIQAAFMSTGLISKKNKFMDQRNHPDTPCKSAAMSVVRKPTARFTVPESPQIGRGKGRLDLLRRDSIASSVGEEDLDVPNSQEVFVPYTPTKATGSVGSLGFEPVTSTRNKLRTDVTPSSARNRRSVATPRTPQISSLLPDPSSLSISGRTAAPCFSLATKPPQTPTGPHNSFEPQDEDGSPSATRSVFNVTMTPVHRKPKDKDHDNYLNKYYKDVEQIGSGAFSTVFKVSARSFSRVNSRLALVADSPRPSSTPRTFAVKRIVLQSSADQTKAEEEALILRTLGRHDHVIRYVKHFEDSGNMYISTEYCELGNLETFLRDYGNRGRLDPFRIWKILDDITSGLQHIHKKGFLHLDMKPANVMISYSGNLKIGDFGMATRWPFPGHHDREGDREYMAPEVLYSQAYDKPADIFSLGLMLLEIAGNVQLPDNGASWSKLRNGDKTEWPEMSSSMLFNEARDVYGFPPISPLADYSSSGFEDSSNGSISMDSFATTLVATPEFSNPFQGNSHFLRSGTDIIVQPPMFMEGDAIEQVLSRLLAPSPGDRYTADEILQTSQLRWLSGRRQAGAIVYEGEWGPVTDETADLMGTPHHGRDGEDFIMLD